MGRQASFFLMAKFLVLFILVVLGKFAEVLVVALTPTSSSSSSSSPATVDIGVVYDLQDPLGRRAVTSISMALEDFYKVNGNYSTKLVLHFRDSQNANVEAASAALDLLKNVQVQAIIGPLSSGQAVFVADLGTKAHVPVLSFSATSPSLSAARTPYFVRTTPNDSSQVGAIAALVQHFQWRQVVPIYQDTEYGIGIIPYLTDALQSVDAKVPYRSMIPAIPTDDQLDKELFKLMTMQTRIFIVHMMPDVAVRLFQKAGEIGMTNSGYVWIITDGIADVLDELDPSIVASMQGVLGIRPRVPRTQKLRSFSFRWRAKFKQDNPGIEATGPGVYQLWAYDTVWALAMAVESANITSGPQFWNSTNSTISSTDLANISVSQTGARLLRSILATRFNGFSGEFMLIDGQVYLSAFEIVNIIGNGYRDIGVWTPADGIIKQLRNRNQSGLKPVLWPGDSIEKPKGWQIPTNGRTMKIGVPVNNGFNEFVNISWDPITNRTTVTGYCIDVFDAVMQSLPYAVSYDYIPFGDPSTGKAAGTYNDMVYEVYRRNFEAVVGDTTIRENRSQYVDFTLPYTQSGVPMIVPMQEDKRKNMWIFLKPLTTDLWFGSIAFFFFTGFVVWVIEHRINPEFRGNPSQQLGTILYFAFSTLTFSHRERLEQNLSKVVVITWVLVVLILTQSYTASLTSMLTIQQLQPTVADLNVLLKNGDYVGYQDESFTKDLLIRLGFDENKLRGYNTPDDYADALTKGSAAGGVAALFDEIPYLKVFLSRYCMKFSMVGPTYNNDGFGFVFPKGSTLVPDISRAILNLTESDQMVKLERKWFGDLASCRTDSNNISSSSLGFRSFGGLFLISGAVSALALVIFFLRYVHNNWVELKASATESSLWRKVAALARHFDSKDLKSPNFSVRNQVVGSDNASTSYSSDLFSTPERSSTAELSVADAQRITAATATVELSWRPQTQNDLAIQIDETLEWKHN